jgi:putative transposase
MRLILYHSSVRYVSWKDYKAMTADLKGNYQASIEESVLKSLSSFSDKWDAQYLKTSRYGPRVGIT